MRHVGRADAAARTDQIAVRVGFFDQLFRNVVQRAIAVTEDGRKLLLLARHDDLRRIVAEPLANLLFAQVADVVCRVRPVRLESLLPFRMLRVQADLANARGDLRRVVDDDFFSFLLCPDN